MEQEQNKFNENIVLVLQRSVHSFLLSVFMALNGSQLFPKIGFMVNPIEGLGQSLSCGFVSIRPQFKEFIYSYFPFY